MVGQILMGSAVLIVCSIVHAAAIVVSVKPLRRIGLALGPRRPLAGALTVLLLALAVVVAAHTAEVWIWAATLYFRGALADFETAIYFALATYTTLGYGDVLVDDDHRIFASMAAVNGLVVFGLSAAFLVEVMTRLLRNRKVT